MKSLFLLIFIPLFCTSQISAQSPHDDFKKVLEQMSSPQNLYYDAQFFYFEEGETVPSDTMIGVYHRAGSREYFRMGNTERLEENGKVIIADHEEKLVAVGSSLEAEKSFAAFDPNLWELRLEANGATVQQESAWDEYRKLKIQTSNDMDNLAKVTFSTRTFRVAEIEILTTEPDESDENAPPRKIRVVMRYFNYDTSYKKFLHRQRDFVLKKGNRYLPAGKCSKYQLL